MCCIHYVNSIAEAEAFGMLACETTRHKILYMTNLYSFILFIFGSLFWKESILNKGHPNFIQNK